MIIDSLDGNYWQGRGFRGEAGGVILFGVRFGLGCADCGEWLRQQIRSEGRQAQRQEKKAV